MKPKPIDLSKINIAGFMQRVRQKGPDECWPWLTYRNVAGYGTYPTSDGKHVFVHRVSYVLEYGPIPEGLTIDHLCRNKLCCNPAHLQAVTQSVNILRYFQKPEFKLCRCGNPRASDKARRCRPCTNAYMREYLGKRRSKRAN